MANRRLPVRKIKEALRLKLLSDKRTRNIAKLSDIQEYGRGLCEKSDNYRFEMDRSGIAHRY